MTTLTDLSTDASTYVSLDTALVNTALNAGKFAAGLAKCDMDIAARTQAGMMGFTRNSHILATGLIQSNDTYSAKLGQVAATVLQANEEIQTNQLQLTSGIASANEHLLIDQQKLAVQLDGERARGLLRLDIESDMENINLASEITTATTRIGYKANVLQIGIDSKAAATFDATEAVVTQNLVQGIELQSKATVLTENLQAKGDVLNTELGYTITAKQIETQAHIDASIGVAAEKRIAATNTSQARLDGANIRGNATLSARTDVSNADLQATINKNTAQFAASQNSSLQRIDSTTSTNAARLGASVSSNTARIAAEQIRTDATLAASAISLTTKTYGFAGKQAVLDARLANVGAQTAAEVAGIGVKSKARIDGGLVKLSARVAATTLETGAKITAYSNKTDAEVADGILTYSTRLDAGNIKNQSAIVDMRLRAQGKATAATEAVRVSTGITGLNVTAGIELSKIASDARLNAYTIEYAADALITNNEVQARTDEVNAKTAARLQVAADKSANDLTLYSEEEISRLNDLKAASDAQSQDTNNINNAELANQTAVQIADINAQLEIEQYSENILGLELKSELQAESNKIVAAAYSTAKSIAAKEYSQALAENLRLQEHNILNHSQAQRDGIKANVDFNIASAELKAGIDIAIANQAQTTTSEEYTVE